MLETQYLSTPLYSVSKNITFSTSDDIDMKLRPVTKTGNRNKKQSKKIDDDVMLTNCDTIVFFPISGQFGAIWKPAFRLIVCKTYIFNNNNLLFCKN